MRALKDFGLLRCKRLTSLPGSLGSYSALTSVHVNYCPAINMKPLYEHLLQRLDSLEYKQLAHVRSSDPMQGTIYSITIFFILTALRFIWYYSLETNTPSKIPVQ